MEDSVTESKILWLSTKGQEKGVKFELVSFGGVERTQVSIRYSFVYMASFSRAGGTGDARARAPPVFWEEAPNFF